MFLFEWKADSYIFFVSLLIFHWLSVPFGLMMTSSVVVIQCSIQIGSGNQKGVCWHLLRCVHFYFDLLGIVCRPCVFKRIVCAMTLFLVSQIYTSDSSAPVAKYDFDSCT